MRKEYWFGLFNGRGFRGGAETRDCIVSTRVCSNIADGLVAAVCMTAMSGGAVLEERKVRLCSGEPTSAFYMQAPGHIASTSGKRLANRH